jgi:peptide/nickel transport system ATP-binding protein
MNLIEMKDLRCTFTVGAGMFGKRRPLHAVNGVSLAVAKGEVLGLVGESGCGKSTLARMLLGLQQPTGGEIRLEGRPLGAHGRQAVARRIQPIFQDPYSSLNPRKTVGAIIGLPLEVHAAHGAEARRRKVEEMMALVGLAPRLYHNYPNQLSGGQRQRVAIARALVTRPEVVVCDEPTSALDVSVQSQILNLLQELRRELGLTYVFISHNLAVVEHIASRVAVMYLGRIVELAGTRELFRAPRHPYTRALLESVLTPEPGLGVPDTHLGAAYPNPIDPPPGCAFHPRCPEAMAQCRSVLPAVSGDSRGEVACHLYVSSASEPARRPS